VSAIYVRDPPAPIHPLHAILLAFPLPLFLGALVADLAYWSTFEVQWLNFASWLIAGALLVGALTLVWALVALAFTAARGARRVAYFVTLLVMWALGFVNALVHGKDAWATMPAGLYLSIVVTLLALAAAWIGYSRWHAGVAR
jgi:uncharacterized membrane protein